MAIARYAGARFGDTQISGANHGDSLLGELDNEVTIARLAFDSMVAITNNFDFQPSLQKSSEVLVRKTILTQAR